MISEKAEPTREDREACARHAFFYEETEKFWPWPWRKPESVYDSNGPPCAMVFEIKGCPLRFRVAPTGDDGCHTARDRYKVECLTCARVLHPNSTGTTNHLQHHAENEHGLFWGPMFVLVERRHFAGDATLKLGPHDYWSAHVASGNRRGSGTAFYEGTAWDAISKAIERLNRRTP